MLRRTREDILEISPEKGVYLLLHVSSSKLPHPTYKGASYPNPLLEIKFFQNGGIVFLYIIVYQCYTYVLKKICVYFVLYTHFILKKMFTEL